MREPIHPGETLRENPDARGMSAAELAWRIEISTNRITGFFGGRRFIAGDAALRLASHFGVSGEFWLNLQKLCKLRRAEQIDGAVIARLPSLYGSDGLRADNQQSHRGQTVTGYVDHCCWEKRRSAQSSLLQSRLGCLGRWNSRKMSARRVVAARLDQDISRDWRFVRVEWRKDLSDGCGEITLPVWAAQERRSVLSGMRETRTVD